MPGNETVVRLVNFDSPTGVATTSPLYVANWNGRKMYLSLISYIVGQGATAGRQTQFTFLSGEPV
jgi:hypothetical protein